MAIAMTIAIGTIATPALKKNPSATATAAISRTKTASITKVRRLLRAICSYMPMAGVGLLLAIRVVSGAAIRTGRRRVPARRGHPRSTRGAGSCPCPR